MNHDWVKWGTTQTEHIHIQFLKTLLGVNRSTTNLSTRSELGRHSLQELILIRSINFINYVEAKDLHSLVKQAANYEMLHIEERN